MSLNRAQWHVISWLPLLHSQWCFQHFFVFLEPLIFPSLLSLSADNLVSNFKEKMWSIIKKLHQLSTNFQPWQRFLLLWLMPLLTGWSIFILFLGSHISFYFGLSLLISFHSSNISHIKKQKQKPLYKPFLSSSWHISLPRFMVRMSRTLTCLYILPLLIPEPK